MLILHNGVFSLMLYSVAQWASPQNKVLIYLPHYALDTYGFLSARDFLGFLGSHPRVKEIIEDT